MVDFAVNTCKMILMNFLICFLLQMYAGSLKTEIRAYIVGKTGCELARLVVSEIRGANIENEDVMYLDKSPEFWLGWALCYYVWLRGCLFKHIVMAVPPGDRRNDKNV